MAFDEPAKVHLCDWPEQVAQVRCHPKNDDARDHGDCFHAHRHHQQAGS